MTILLIVASMGSIAAACGSPDGARIEQAPITDQASADLGAPAATDVASGAPGEPATHYIEFRARLGSMPYGHTYMVYGRLDETGEPMDETIVGLLPSGGFAGLAIGTVVDVPGIVGSSTFDDVMPVLNAYRQTLTETQYDSLLATIERVKGDVPDWGLFGYNCNWFANQLAFSVGMRAPNETGVMPAFYVEALRTANEGPEAAGDAGRVATGSPVER